MNRQFRWAALFAVLVAALVGGVSYNVAFRMGSRSGPRQADQPESSCLMAGIAHGDSVCSVRSCSSCSGCCCSGFSSGAAFIDAGVIIRAGTTRRTHLKNGTAARMSG